MKRSADELDAENPIQDDRKKCMAIKSCTPFCEDNCRYRGSHDKLILSLVNLQDSKLEEWKTVINEAKESRDLDQPLEDPDPGLRYPLLHWAAILGKVKAVTWLLQQEFIHFSINPADPVSSLSNFSNEKVLFSMVRFLHEGVETRIEGDILDKYFAKILDVFLKHDPHLLLVPEGDAKDTVLHLCARREEDATSPSSTAPFFKYLKRILGKLEEYSKKKDSRLPETDLIDILEKKNEKGDAFIHLLARSTIKREDAKKLIDFAKDKFKSLGSLRNAERKTAEVIWIEFKPNPDVYQTSSQGMHDSSDREDEKPTQDLAYVKREIALHGPSVGTNGDRECPGGSGEEIRVEPLQIQSQGLLTLQCNTAVQPEVQLDGGRGDKGEIPPRLFQEPLSDEGNEGQNSLQTEVGTQSGCSSTDTQSRTQDGVKELIHETELELIRDKKELEEAQRIRDECEERLKQLRAEVQRLQVKVQAKQKKLKNYNTALQLLLN